MILPIRVLHVVHQMNRAGTETLLMHIYRKIDRSRVQFDFLVHTDLPGQYDDEILQLGGKIIIISQSPSQNYLKYKQKLRNIFLEHGPYQCIHSHLLLLSGIIFETAHQSHIPLLVVHSHLSTDIKRNSIYRRVYGYYMRTLIARFATHMIAVSKSSGEWLFGSNWLHDSRSKIIHNAMDLEPFRKLNPDRTKLREILGLPINGIIIGHIGRFVEQKNHRKVIEIFGTFEKDLPSAHLLLIGEGPLESEVKLMITSYGLEDKVLMLGVRKDIPELMNIFDLFLFPSLHEGLGIVLIEAQAAGVPCLTSDTIPPEADLGLGLMKQMPLDATADDWASAAINLIKPVRICWPDREAALIKNHYEISELVNILQDIYLVDHA
ncbi:MAG: glycosyltransferase [Chloroflexota bacterium]